VTLVRVLFLLKTAVEGDCDYQNQMHVRNLSFCSQHSTVDRIAVKKATSGGGFLSQLGGGSAGGLGIPPPPSVLPTSSSSSQVTVSSEAASAFTVELEKGKSFRYKACIQKGSN
jgi:hypothetical protein